MKVEEILTRVETELETEAIAKAEKCLKPYLEEIKHAKRVLEKAEKNLEDVKGMDIEDFISLNRSRYIFSVGVVNLPLT